MGKRMPVGRSSVTPVKHQILNSIMGKVAGALSLDNPSVPCRITQAEPFVCVDLCGGDGSEKEGQAASPVIMHKHCEWLWKRGKRATLEVIEIQPNTYEQLIANCRDMIGDGVVMTLGDARTFTLPPMGERQAAFIHCDPNTVDQMPVTESLVDSFNRYTTYFATLGCNVSGLKMLPSEKRAGWFTYADRLTRKLPRHHDAILFWLNRNSAQWAYLLSIPTVWSRSFKEDTCRVTSKMWTQGVSAVSYRSERRAFEAQLDTLFLTKAENAAL
jgi:hypothetical protein